MKVVLSILACMMLTAQVTIGQQCTRYDVWTSEDHVHARRDNGEFYNSTEKKFLYPGPNDDDGRYLSSSINYEDVKYALPGDFNGDGVQELALLLWDDATHMRIYVIESRGLRHRVNTNVVKNAFRRDGPPRDTMLVYYGMYDLNNTSEFNRQEQMAQTNLSAAPEFSGQRFGMGYTYHPTLFHGRYEIDSATVCGAAAGYFSSATRSSVALLVSDGGRSKILRFQRPTTSDSSFSYTFAQNTVLDTTRLALNLDSVRFTSRGSSLIRVA